MGFEKWDRGPKVKLLGNNLPICPVPESQYFEITSMQLPAAVDYVEALFDMVAGGTRKVLVLFRSHVVKSTDVRR